MDWLKIVALSVVNLVIDFCLVKVIFDIFFFFQIFLQVNKYFQWHPNHWFVTLNFFEFGEVWHKCLKYDHTMLTCKGMFVQLEILYIQINWPLPDGPHSILSLE